MEKKVRIPVVVGNASRSSINIELSKGNRYKRLKSLESPRIIVMMLHGE